MDALRDLSAPTLVFLACWLALLVLSHWLGRRPHPDDCDFDFWRREIGED